MRCTERRPQRARLGAAAGRVLDRVATVVGGAATAALVTACAPPAPPSAPSRGTAPAASSAAPSGAAAPTVMRSVEQLKLHVARRIVAANPQGTYLGAPPETLLAIPVLEIELDADGSVRRISVLRQPRHAHDTTQLAIDAVRRAAPFGNVSQVPKPWKFSETFLFDDERRFKPLTLER